MSAKIINYYACANSAQGFANYFEDNIKGLDKLFILKGGPGTGKSTLIKKVGTEWYSRGFDVEFVHCSSDNSSLDGVIVPSIGFGVVDGTAPHVIEPIAPGAIEEYVNLGEAWNSAKLAIHKDTILSINNKISLCYTKAYKQFEVALKIHDEWEQVYIKNINFDKLNDLTGSMIQKIFGDEILDKTGREKNRFFGGATPIGPADFVMDLTESIGKRYFLKGRPGSGKSTMLNKIATTAKAKGFDVEIYHCGFDINSLDMIIIRELDVAIFDSTAPHEYFPTKESDEIIDVYSYAIRPNTDEDYSVQLSSIVKRYNSVIDGGIAQLANAKLLHDELESFYIPAMDFNKIDEITANILAKADDYFFNLG